MRQLFPALLGLFLLLPASLARAEVPRDGLTRDLILGWERMALLLTRHTPTFSPPVASRTIGYLGVTGYEVVASGRPDQMQSLAGQMNGLTALPARPQGVDDAVAADAAMGAVVTALFAHTGPTGQRALKAMTAKSAAKASEGLQPAVVEASAGYGRAVGQAILGWAATDGGDRIDNMGFPDGYTPNPEPGHWVPTSHIALQQAPLLPGWGKNRPFVLKSGADCGLPPPPAWSTDPASPAYIQARAAYDTSRSLTPDQKAMARFWSDDAMLSVTPPGHWLSIAMQVIEERDVPLPNAVDALARLGAASADAFIGCWSAKFQYDFIRPITYINQTIDTKWTPLLITPPFPEYPSGHSTLSGAAAAVLTDVWGAEPFTDHTGERDGLAPRSFPNFEAAAKEAALSRLYGGIHFRAAIEQGLAQGQCIAKAVRALRTLK